MGTIIFQLLSCLYLYDSGMPVPVNCRKHSRYTGVRRLALTYRGAVDRLPTPQGSLRKAGIPASDATGKFPQSRYTGNRRPKGCILITSASVVYVYRFKIYIYIYIYIYI